MKKKTIDNFFAKYFVFENSKEFKQLVMSNNTFMRSEYISCMTESKNLFSYDLNLGIYQ